jgi:hypothetical protein
VDALALHVRASEFPYSWLIDENARRGKLDPEFELVDTGVFDDGRYWEITADYAKASPEEILIRISVRNAGPEAAMIDVLQTLWFRNMWSLGLDPAKPSIRLRDGDLVAEHAALGSRLLRGDGSPAALFCENETNKERLFGVPYVTRYPKDGINDHVVQGAPTVNTDAIGTKAALRYTLDVEPGATATIELRLGEPDAPEADFRELVRARAGRGRVLRRPDAAGRVLGRGARVAAGARGDAVVEAVLPLRRRALAQGGSGRAGTARVAAVRVNREWTHLNNMDVISMPDTWEYPWYAAWDLAFHCVALAHVDPEFAKQQLLLLCREWYMHPNGQLPAYEWAFGGLWDEGDGFLLRRPPPRGRGGRSSP